jgi:two-component system chemotaxis response regulator CheB
VQDPSDAAYPDMPQNALNNLKPDYCLPVGAIGQLLTEIILKPVPKSPPVPEDIASEATIAERVLGDVTAVENLGEQVSFNCPNCWRGSLEDTKRESAQVSLPYRPCVHRRCASNRREH